MIIEINFCVLLDWGVFLTVIGGNGVENKYPLFEKQTNTVLKRKALTTSITIECFTILFGKKELFACSIQNSNTQFNKGKSTYTAIHIPKDNSTLLFVHSISYTDPQSAS